MATKVVDLDVEELTTAYTVTSNDVASALTEEATENICGQVVVRTEHPKLLVYETAKGNSLFGKRKVSVQNMDIFSYINSKFVYVERHIK